MTTSARPMLPATRPAFSEARPRVADTVSAFDESNASGSEPYFSTLARSVAFCWVKLPEIIVLPPGMASSMVGADTTWPSSTNAACLPMLAAV